jgi:hypothetical protein
MDLVHVERREAAPMPEEAAEVVVRILVAIQPRMYGEVLGFHIHKERPLSEVVFATPETLRDEVRRTRPHLIIANEVPSDLKEQMGVLVWVELSTDDGLVASISANGHSTTIHDVSLQDFLAVVDKAEEELAHDEQA